jgi:DNA modification methylase
MTDYLNRTHLGDCRELMRSFRDHGVQVQCIVTSPPYWGLRDYGMPGQLGLERTWQRHVARMRSVFRLARELLTPDGTLWLNYGDSYYSPRVGGAVGANSTINGQGTQQAYKDAQRARNSPMQQTNIANATPVAANRRHGQRGLKPKDMVGMPWRIAFALQMDGWYLRSDIVWHKPNPMPESVSDRPTKAHEYLFLLSRSERYYYDASAISEPTTGNAHPRGQGVNPKAVAGWNMGEGSHEAKDHSRGKRGKKQDAQAQVGGGDRMTGFNDRYRAKQNASFSAAVTELVPTRNARTVWSIPTQPFAGAHFATFPEELVRRCILAGSCPGDVVFDPFMGSGTVAKVATDLGRHFLGCELSAEYLKLHELRRTTTGFAL